MAVPVNMAKMTVTGTPSTGTITLNAAVTGFQTFALAGVRDGQRVSVSILDAGVTYLERATYTASGTTLSDRAAATPGGTVGTLTSAAIVEVAILAEDSGVPVAAVHAMCGGVI